MNHNNNNNIQIARPNGTQACAACKYQRRKCAADCILAPYFPHDRQRQFLNAHKLFGVSNITKIIRNLDQPDKDEAMRSIIFQSDVRATDPVGGCYRIICDLQRQIVYNRAELEIVLHQLSICRAQAQSQMLINADGSNDSSTTLNCGDIDSFDVMNNFNNLYLQPQPAEDQPYIFQNDDAHVPFLEVVNSWPIQNSTVHVKQPSAVDDGSVKPIFDVNSGARQQFKFELQETIDQRSSSSKEAIFKEESKPILGEVDNDPLSLIQQHDINTEDHDLKGAATLFTLTNGNSFESRD